MISIRKENKQTTNQNKTRQSRRYRRKPGRRLEAMPLCGHLLLAVTVICSTLVGCQKPSSVSKRHDVYIAGFFPFSPEMLPETATGRGVMPAVKLAIEHINENSAVLRNYRLHMWWNDTQVAP